MQTITRAEFLAITQIVPRLFVQCLPQESTLDSAVAGDIFRRFEVVKIKAHGKIQKLFAIGIFIRFLVTDLQT